MTGRPLTSPDRVAHPRVLRDPIRQSLLSAAMQKCSKTEIMESVRRDATAVERRDDLLPRAASNSGRRARRDPAGPARF